MRVESEIDIIPGLRYKQGRDLCQISAIIANCACALSLNLILYPALVMYKQGRDFSQISAIIADCACAVILNLILYPALVMYSTNKEEILVKFPP